MSRLLSALLLNRPRCSSAYAIECPAKDCFPFLHAFSKNIAIQTASASVPLHKNHPNTGAMPDPATVHEQLNRNQIRFPAIPDAARRKQDALVTHIEQKNGTEAKAKLLKETPDFRATTFYQRPVLEMNPS